jgi:hypothetical protein
MITVRVTNLTTGVVSKHDFGRLPDNVLQRADEWAMIDSILHRLSREFNFEYERLM